MTLFQSDLRKCPRGVGVNLQSKPAEKGKEAGLSNARHILRKAKPSHGLSNASFSKPMVCLVIHYQECIQYIELRTQAGDPRAPRIRLPTEKRM